ncbi:MAG: hypothetical protein DWQ01_01085 [Planctomycetota bacterium]|nr:MAG: hypothetical protein DWQ01_01085 [Planctomycetota bacterium]
MKKMKSFEDPLHPILDRPWEYAIAALYFHAGLDGQEPYFELTLVRNGSQERKEYCLRFLSPQDLEIERGCFPNPTGGMVILDVRDRQLDGLGVRVCDVE